MAACFIVCFIGWPATRLLWFGKHPISPFSLRASGLVFFKAISWFQFVLNFFAAFPMSVPFPHFANSCHPCSVTVTVGGGQAWKHFKTTITTAGRIHTVHIKTQKLTSTWNKMKIENRKKYHERPQDQQVRRRFQVVLAIIKLICNLWVIIVQLELLPTIRGKSPISKYYSTANPCKNVYKIGSFGGEFQNKKIHTPCIQLINSIIL